MKRTFNMDDCKMRHKQHIWLVKRGTVSLTKHNKEYVHVQRTINTPPILTQPQPTQPNRNRFGNRNSSCQLN